MEKVIKLMVENDPDDYDINKKKEMLEESNETLKHVEKKRVLTAKNYIILLRCI